ncbi:MAG: hypothetical protein AAGA15_17180 [Pseudomonadota bacterium]
MNKAPTPATQMDDLARWKSIARKSSRLAERNGLALDNIEQHDPGLVEHALAWANAEMTKRYKSGD